MMKKDFVKCRIISIITLIFLVGCEQSSLFINVDCSECYTDKPANGDLMINVTINDINPSIPITIYEGNVENNKVVYTDTLYDETFYLYVTLNKTYSVKASYKSGEKIISAIDGTKIETMKVTDSCDETCWIIVKNKLDVRLKY